MSRDRKMPMLKIKHLKSLLSTRKQSQSLGLSNLWKMLRKRTLEKLRNLKRKYPPKTNLWNKRSNQLGKGKLAPHLSF